MGNMRSVYICSIILGILTVLLFVCPIAAYYNDWITYEEFMGSIGLSALISLPMLCGYVVLCYSNYRFYKMSPKEQKEWVQSCNLYDDIIPF